jgi:hypothetical protein
MHPINDSTTSGILIVRQTPEEETNVGLIRQAISDSAHCSWARSEQAARHKICTIHGEQSGIPPNRSFFVRSGAKA